MIKRLSKLPTKSNETAKVGAIYANAVFRRAARDFITAVLAHKEQTAFRLQTDVVRHIMLVEDKNGSYQCVKEKNVPIACDLLPAKAVHWRSYFVGRDGDLGCSFSANKAARRNRGLIIQLTRAFSDFKSTRRVKLRLGASDEFRRVWSQS